MSTWYSITIDADQRVLLGRGRLRAFLTDSYPFIPGSVIRGALAAAWVANGGQRDRSFERVFESGRFRPAFPDGVGVQAQSMRECKYHSDEADHPGHHDEATDGRLSPGERGCHGFDFLKGGYWGGQLVTETTTALEPRKHIAKEHQLFSRKAVERKTIFEGMIVLPEGDHSRLVSIKQAFMGGRGSVRGRVQVSIRKAQRPVQVGDRLVLTTLTPTILVDETGAPSADLDRGLTELGFDVVDTWANRIDSDAASGWHAASDLPKPAEIALAPGAVAVVKRPSQEVLAKLLDAGLGLRTSEGYGWVEASIGTHPLCQLSKSPQEVPKPAPTQVAPPAEKSFAERVDELQLTPDQRRWLAKKLHLRSEHKPLTDGDLSEPIAGRLSSEQIRRIRAMIAEVPPDQRNSLAHAITKGAS